MQRLNDEGKFEEMKPFDNRPEEFAFYVTDRWLPSIERGSHGFHPRGYSLIPHLEYEAIQALKPEFPELPRRAAKPTDPDSYEEWRAVWAAEARYHYPYPESHGYDRKASAAINILVISSQLRMAVEQGETEKAAALGMLLAFTAIDGGYALEMDARAETQKAIRKARVAPLVMGNKAIADAKKWAVGFAREKWKADTEKRIRITEMAETIWAEILGTEHANQRPETIDTVKSWIRPIAPDYAKKGGRPKKKP